MTPPTPGESGKNDGEFVEGYMDGYDLLCPEPNGNRHPAYVHSFKIGRAEKTGGKIECANVLRKRAKIIEDNS